VTKLARRAAPHRAAGLEAGHLKPDTDPEQLVGEIYALVMGLVHDTRFLRDTRAAERAQATWDACWAPTSA
jgi:hypothetical protein